MCILLTTLEMQHATSNDVQAYLPRFMFLLAIQYPAK